MKSECGIACVQLQLFLIRGSNENADKSSGDFIFIRGDLQVDIELECSRCLKKYEDILSINIDEKFLKGAKTPVTSKEHQMKKADFIEELDGITEIDLNDLIYQNIIINIPSQTLCDENCEGLEEMKKYIVAKRKQIHIEDKASSVLGLINNKWYFALFYFVI